MAWSKATTDVDKLLILSGLAIFNGLLVYFLPQKSISDLRNLKNWFIQDERRLYLLLTLVALTVGTIYAYNQRTWVDEDSSFRAAKIIANQGVEGIATSYKNVPWLRDQHPPLIIIIYGVVTHFLGENLFYARLVSVLFFSMTLLSTYLLGREFYHRETGFLAVFIFLSFPLVTRLSAAAMMDIQLTFFFSLAILLTFKLRERPSFWLSILTGFVIGLGLLTKYIMILFFPVLLVMVLVNPSFLKVKFHLFGAMLVSFFLLFVWFLYASSVGILSGQIQRIFDYSGITYFAKDVGGLQSPGQLDTQQSIPEGDSGIVRTRIIQLGIESLVTRIPSSIGIYNLPLILIGAGLVLKNRDQQGLVLLLWISIVFGILFITLLDHRYLLMTFPAIAILVTRIFQSYPQNAERFLILTLLLWLGSLYLFVDWHREILLFLPNP